MRCEQQLEDEEAWDREIGQRDVPFQTGTHKIKVWGR
jgi:hypothetical protein